MFEWTEFTITDEFRLKAEAIPAVYKKAHEGNKEAIEKLFLHTFGWIKKIAKNYRGKSLTFDELISAGTWGLFNSIKSNCYDPKKGAWSTYVSFYIRAEIMRQLKRNTVLPVPHNRYGEQDLPLCFPESGFGKNFSIIDCYDEKFQGEEVNFEDINSLKDELKKLSEREKEILYLRYHKNLTYRAIGEIVEGLTRERIRQIIEKALEKLREYC